MIICSRKYYISEKKSYQKSQSYAFDRIVIWCAHLCHNCRHSLCLMSSVRSFTPLHHCKVTFARIRDIVTKISVRFCTKTKQKNPIQSSQTRIFWRKNLLQQKQFCHVQIAAGDNEENQRKLVVAPNIRGVYALKLSSTCRWMFNLAIYIGNTALSHSVARAQRARSFELLTLALGTIHWHCLVRSFVHIAVSLTICS